MLICNAVLWDGTGAEARRGWSLRTDGERIAWIGPNAQEGLPRDEPTIDAAGRWLLPGLIDLHVHLTFDPAQVDTLRYALTVPASEQALVGARNARLMLASGFTTTRDLGSAGSTDAPNLALQRAVDAGLVSGPRIVAAGAPLTVPGGHFDWLTAPDVQRPTANVVSGADAVRRAVREQVKRGAGWIKLLVTGGVLSAGTPLGAALWEDDELRAAVTTAARLGRPAAAHCHGAAGMIAAAEAGVATIEHGTMGDAAAAEAMARHGTVLVPTFSAAAAVVREARAGTLPPGVAAQALQIEVTHGASFRAALDAGVKVACGTDTGVPGTAFGDNAQELVHLVQHGLSPQEALLAATRAAAAVLGWQDRIGTLEPGKLADLILVDGDPLHDVAVLADPQRIHAVVKGGLLEKSLL